MTATTRVLFLLFFTLFSTSIFAEKDGRVWRTQSTAAAIILELRSLLFSQQVEELNHRLEHYQNSVFEDIKNETDLAAAYNTFNVEDPSYEPLLDQWVAETPDHYAPYLARARFHYRMGWVSRGHSFARETSREQVEGMKTSFAKAKKDLYQSLVIEHRAMFIYYLLVYMANVEGEASVAKAMMESGLEIYPDSFILRVAYMHGLTPRWGGSFEAMEAYAQESMRAAENNPNLNLLQGFAYAEAGDLHKIRKNYHSAVEQYSNALSFGGYAPTYYERGKAYYYQGEYEKALDDFLLALEFDSGQGLYYYWYARVLTRLDRIDEAIESINFAEQLYPATSEVEEQKERIAHQLVVQGYEFDQKYQYREALDKYSIAIELDENNADIYYRRSRAYGNLHRLEQALIDVKRAIRLSPDEINYYIYVDWILAQRKEWQTIIEYWTQFVERNPSVGRAYMERGGAYYHSGQRELALQDLKVAADMGDPQAQAQYRRMTGQ